MNLMKIKTNYNIINKKKKNTILNNHNSNNNNNNNQIKNKNKTISFKISKIKRQLI